MQTLLISFCNVHPPGFVLGAFDFETEDFRWIDTGKFVPHANGATGTARTQEEYWAIHQGNPCILVRLDSDLAPHAMYALPVSRDAHSVDAYANGLLIADTQANRITLARVTRETAGIEEREFWRGSELDTDQLHVNSVCHIGEDVYVSLFGPKPIDGWRTSEKGEIRNITRRKMVCEGLHHPHSLLSHDGSIFWLESRRGRVHRYTPGGHHEVLLELKGYLRGLAFDEQYIYIGASALRRHSRSTGTLNQVTTTDPEEFCSWIYRIFRRTLQVERRNVTAYGAEVYDLMLVPTTSADLRQSFHREAATCRFWRIEDELRAATDRIQEYELQLKHWQATASQLSRTVTALECELASARRMLFLRTRRALARTMRWFRGTA